MLSETTYTITDTSDATYPFTFDWVRVSHIKAYINDVAVPTADISVSGDSGSAVLTLSGTTFSNLELNDELLIKKETPTGFDDRTVDFTADGSVSLASLDDAILHTISFCQDLTDQYTDALRKSSSWDNDFNAEGLQIKNLGTGLTANSAVTLAQLQAVETSSGALPSVTTAFNNYVLGVVAGSWGTVSPDSLATILGLGSAAYRDIEADGSGVLDQDLGDSRWLQISGAFSEIATAGTEATARTNLGLGTAATKDTGTSAGNVVEVDGSGNIPAGIGLDSGVSFVGTSVYHKSGGLRDAIQIVELEEEFAINVDNDGVVVSDDFETDSANNVGVVDAGSGAPDWEYNNTTPTEVSVNATTDVVNLTAGTWELELAVTITNEKVAAIEDRVGLALYDTDGAGTLIKKVNNQYTKVGSQEDGTGGPATFILRAIYTFAGGARAIAIRIAGDTDSVMYVVNGTLRCHRLA